MAWSAPLTAVNGVALTAAQWNASVRDNLNETGPAVATTSGRLIVSDGANSITERAVLRAYVTTTQSTTSTTYAPLTTDGPYVVIDTGASAIQYICCLAQNGTAGAGAYASYIVTGATTISADDSGSLAYRASNAGDWIRASAVGMTFGSLNSGSNRFTMRYRVSSGTGSFQLREIIVIAL